MTFDNLIIEKIPEVKNGKILTTEHCIKNSNHLDFTEKLLIVKADVLSPEYRNDESQIVFCTHGSGARPDAKGTSTATFSTAFQYKRRHKFFRTIC